MADAGNLLVRAGLLDPGSVARAREAQAQMGGTLAEHLVLAGLIADDELTQFFRERLMVPRVAESRLHDLPNRIISKIPRDMASELRVIPVSLDRESSLTVAMSDPSDTHALDELEFFTEHYVVRAVASQRQIAWCLANYYKVVTPLYDDSRAGEAKFEQAKTEPFLRSDPPKRRPGRVSRAVAASRRKVMVPATAPPSPLEATLADLEYNAMDTDFGADAEPSIQIAEEPDLLTGVGDADELEKEAIDQLSGEHEAVVLEVDDDDDDIYPEVPATLADGSPAELAPRAGEMLVNHGRARDLTKAPAIILDDSLFALDDEPIPEAEPETVIELVPDDTKHESIAPPTDAFSEEIEELEPEAIELIADEPEPPPEPEVVMTIEAEPEDLSEAAILTEAEDLSEAAILTEPEGFSQMAALAEAEAEAEDLSDSAVLEDGDDTEITSAGWIEDIETIEHKTAERGTDSAPFLLSEIKEAAERADAERAAAAKKKTVIETEPVDESEIDAEAVVLLETPKRAKRRTSLGHGAPAARAAKVLNLRTGRKTDVDELAASAFREAADQARVPTVTDDHDNSAPLAELDVDDTSPMVLPAAGLSTADAAAAAHMQASVRPPTSQPELDSDDATRLLDALETLGASSKRDQIVAALLDYLDDYCERVVFLAVRSGALEPWQIRSSEPTRPREGASLPLRELSLFRDVVDTRLPYRGAVSDAPSRGLLEAVFGGVEHEGLAVPVAVRNRVVGLLYGEGISDQLSGDNIAIVTQAVGRALERVIKRSPRVTPP